MPRTLITGGAGFLGSHLCDRLIEEGHEVICLDNLITGQINNVAHLIGHERFRFIKQDVTEYLYIEGPLDYVPHFASPASPVDYQRLPIQTLKVGSLGTHKALGLAKAYRRYHGLDTRIARVVNTYGPRMRPRDGRVVSNFINQALRGEPLTVYGDGSQTRSFCYVSDLVEGLYRLLMSDEVNPVNIGNPKEFTVLDLARMVLETIGGPSTIVFRELPLDDPRVRQPDIGLARVELGWEPKVQIAQGLALTIEYFRKQMGS